MTSPGLHAMRDARQMFLILLVASLAGCSTVSSRIGDQQSFFDSLPPATQQAIRNGQVQIGFTPEMTTMSLGEPDRRYSRTTALGTSEVWAYRQSSPAFSFGIGGFGLGRGSAVGGGLGVSTGGDAPDDRERVIFENGLVAEVEIAH